jgi:WD40 repeat protein
VPERPSFGTLNIAPAIPDHTLLRPIGRGAYGEVWLARNVMGAPRAVKIIWRRSFESDRPYEREFAGIQRYEPVSRTADGLVHVLHVGRNDTEAYFYYVMELADPVVPFLEVSESPDQSDPSPLEKTSLLDYAPRTFRSDLKRMGRLPVADCLRVALDVVGGLARLHDCGLVHRDVKPGNIIFVEGRAKLADIGLVSKESEGRTFVGTEGYIPPEGPGSPAADLYALGMVLYEALTGYVPEQFPKVPPEWFAEEAAPEPLEFQEVVLKACEAAKERRYQNAGEMRADIALLQSGQSVRHLRALEKRESYWRRIGWAAVIIVALALTTSFVAYWRASVAAEGEAKEIQLREQAQKSQARAESAEKESRHQLYTSLLEQARATVRSGELGQRVRALDAVRRAAAISNSVELRQEVIAALALPDLRFERELPNGPEFTVREMDPKFERIALCQGRGPVEIYSASKDGLLATLPASTNLMCYNAHWSSDGKFLAVKRDYDPAGSRGDLEIWNVSSTERALLLRELWWTALAFHPCKPQLIMARADGWVVHWDLQERKELARWKFESIPEHLAWSPDGQRLAISYPSKDAWVVSLHHAADGTRMTSHQFPNAAESLVWHPGGQWIAVSDISGAIHWMDPKTAESHIIGQHQAEAVTTTFSPAGDYLVSGGWERDLICWDVIRQKRAFTIGLDSYYLQFRADGAQCSVVTPSAVRLYAFDSPRAHREFAEDLGSRLRHATFSPDGGWLAATADKRLGLWDLSGGGGTALSEEGVGAECFFTSDGAELFGSLSRDGETDCLRWRITHSMEGNAPSLERIAFKKPEGFTFLSVHSNSVVLTGTKGSQLLDLKAREARPEGWAQTSPGLSGASPDGRWLAIYEPFGMTLYVYRLPDLVRVAQLPHPASIGDFKFSPHGNELAICSRARVELWSTRTWEQTRALTNFSRILYTPDQNAVWLTKNMRTGGLYNARTLEPLLLLPGNTFPLALSPDGQRLAVSVDTRRLQVWELPALRAHFRDLGLDWANPVP